MSTVNLLGLGMTLQKPTELKEPEVNDDSGYSLTELNAQHRMFKEIVVDFENAGLQVLKIEQLRNHLLWQKYTHGMKVILERKPQDPAFELNEKYLYHGTSVDKDSICTEGLDQRMAKKGCFGKGIYFSDYPQKCVKYAQKAKTESLILLERVILGKSKEYRDGVRERSLQREPEKDMPFIGWRFFDSVTGCPKDHREYVVYNSDRALIECIITYSSNKESNLNSSATASNSSKSLPPSTSVSLQKAPSTESTTFHVTPSNTYFPSNDDDDHHHSDTTDEERNSDSSDSLEDDGCSSDSSSELKDDKRHNRKYDDNKKAVVTPKTVDKTSPEDILAQKRKEFILKTGESNEHVIESFLVAADLVVDRAVELFLGKDKKRKQMEQQKKKEKEVEVEVEEFYEAEEHLERENAGASSLENPMTDPEKWKKLSEGDREAIIEALTDNFLTITSLDDNDVNRRQSQKILSSCDYNLDLSIVAFYDGI